MPKTSLQGGALALAASVLAGLTVAGCAPGDIALEGKVFGALGSAIGANSGGPREVKVAARPGLVVPPRLDNLPSPDAAGSASNASIDGIQDHDRKRVVDKVQQEKAQREFCEKNYVLPKARGEDVEEVEGPAGPCRPSILNSLAKWNTSSE